MQRRHNAKHRAHAKAQAVRMESFLLRAMAAALALTSVAAIFLS